MANNCNLSLQSIITYANISPNSRNLIEAERLLKSNFIITFGATKITENKLDILALCLKTSAMKETPHVLKGTLLKNNLDLEIGNFHCSCKAGAGVCKHKTAVLLMCYRNDLKTIPLLSSTDVKCIWASKKQNVHEMYMPVPISDFCHVKCVQNEVNQHINPDHILKRFIEVCPNSALAQNLQALPQRKHDEEDLNPVNSPRRFNSVQENDVSSLIKRILQQNVPFTMMEPEMPLDQKKFYERNIVIDLEKAFQISQVEQSSESWRTERKMRITASKCYELFTYAHNKNPDWSKKTVNYFKEMFTGNFATDYGLQNESEAIHAFEKKNNLQIIRTGLIIQPDIPWLGYSPDGLFLKDGQLKIMEIKCPVQGIKTSAVDLVQNLNYINVKDGVYSLKEKHKYYGQVQCGMHVTGAEECYFIIYATYDKSYVLFIVKRDEKFIEKQFCILHDVFFKHFLPYISEIKM